MEREYDHNAGASSQHQRIRSCPLDLAGTLYAQGELAGARKLEEQMLEALASDNRLRRIEMLRRNWVENSH